MVTLRPALSPSSVPTSTDIPTHAPAIHFHHPGYKRHSLLFSLYGYDTPEGGIHHETARIACAIIACNRFDGYLSTSRHGPRIELDAHSCLTGSDYYFIVPPRDAQATSPPPLAHHATVPAELGPATSIPVLLPPDRVSTPTMASSPSRPQEEDLNIYPVVPCFREWEFPHGDLPESWVSPIQDQNMAAIRSTSHGVMIRDASCRMTAYVEECDVAHLCPEKEDRWFKDNEMDRYATSQRRTAQAIDDPANLLLLRADVHRAFDKMHFVFLPKVNGVLSTHVLGESRHHRVMYHNTTLHPTAVAPQYLFARFAWALFPFLTGFLDRGRDRRLKLFAKDEPIWESAVRCSEFTKPARPRDSSPEKSVSPSKKSKRKRTEEETITADHLYVGARTVAESDDVGHGRKKRRIESTLTAAVAIDPTNSGSPVSSQSASPSSLQVVAEPEESAEVTDVWRLRDEMLEKERARSDPQGKWNMEQYWLRSVFDNGGVLDSSQYIRLFDALGVEVIPSSR